MAIVMIRHRIEDYARWKKEFDGFVEQRRAGGERAYRVAHAAGDTNNLCLTFDWDTAANATNFLESPELAATMKRAGVCEKPETWIAEELSSGRT